MNPLQRAWLAGALALACSTARPAGTIDFPGVGTVTIEPPPGPPTEVVIFLSGDGGWSEGVVGMAQHLTAAGALVAGVDVTQMAKRQAATAENCVSAAAALEGLAHFVEQKYGLPQYLKPMLVGYSSGATLAYASLAQAPSGTFKGAVSLGFCPDLEWTKPLCRGEGLEHDPASKVGFVYRPATHLHEPWIALQGDQDQVCDADKTAQFVARVPGASVVLLPKVGHGYSVERNWLPQFLRAYSDVAGATDTFGSQLPASVGDLPLVEVPAAGRTSDVLAIMLSGDGGWAGLDQAVAAELHAQGVAVVGLDSLRYFWSARTPDGAAHDLERVMQHYARAWSRPRIVLIGYSQGADVLPFIVNRLGEASRRAVAGTALIGLSDTAFFEFHVSHWLGTPSGGLPIPPELARLHVGRVLCIHGADEADSPCPRLKGEGLRSIELPGGHHFNGDYVRVARALLEGLQP